MTKVSALSPDISQVAAFCGLAAAGIGIAGLIGLFLPAPVLTGAFLGYKAISFSAAVTWICLGLVLAVMTTRPVTGVRRAVLAGILCVVILTQGIEFPLNIRGDHSPVEQLLIAASSSLTTDTDNTDIPGCFHSHPCGGYRASHPPVCPGTLGNISPGTGYPGHYRSGYLVYQLHHPVKLPVRCPAVVQHCPCSHIRTFRGRTPVHRMRDDGSCRAGCRTARLFFW